MSEIIGIEYSLDDNDGEEDGSLSSEESLAILEEDHDEDDFNEHQNGWDNDVQDPIDIVQNRCGPVISSIYTRDIRCFARS